MRRNFVATLLFSQGVPMLLAGDEMGHSQSGNNNAYCQDNDLTWLDWDLNEEQRAFCDFVKKVTRICAVSRCFRGASSSRGVRSEARTSRISPGWTPTAAR